LSYFLKDTVRSVIDLGCGKKVAPKVFRRFLSNSLKFQFQFEILQHYLLKRFTSNRQIKFDSLKNDEVINFLT